MSELGIEPSAGLQKQNGIAMQSGCVPVRQNLYITSTCQGVKRAASWRISLFSMMRRRRFSRVAWSMARPRSVPET